MGSVVAAAIVAPTSHGQCTASEDQAIVGDVVVANDRFGNAVAIHDQTIVVGAWFADAVGSNSGAAFVFAENAGVWEQRTMLSRADATANDWFGSAVVVENDVAIVCAANAGRENTNFDGRGAAYVFEDDGNDWIELARLTPAVRQPGDRFGTVAALDGDVLAIGAPQTTGGGPGKIVVFRNVGGVWSEEITLTASDGMAGDGFGSAVNVNGETIAVGAPFANSGVGKAYVFAKIAGVWQERAALSPANPTANELFGTAVSLQASELFVGRPQAEVSGTVSGAVTRFAVVATQWQEQETFTANNANANIQFGASLALEGDVLIVGATHDQPGGAAYTFLDQNGTWNEIAKLTGTGSGSAARFGAALTFSGGVACVGAPQCSADATNAGAAFVFIGLDDALPDSCIASGACCFPNDTCLILSEPDCTSAGASFAGANTDCADTTGEGVADICETGACCLLDGSCSIAAIADCEAMNGIYSGANVSCVAAACVPRGACCLSDGTCTAAQSQSECDAVNGLYQGDESTCEASTCEPFGACCLADGTCDEQITADECATRNGVYAGDGVACSAADCEPFGACCETDGTCLPQENEADCLTANGIYRGDGSSCDDAMCVPRGACCNDDQTCSENVEQPTCELTGFFLGGGSDCMDVQCDPLGACCASDEACSLAPEAECLAGGNIYRGDGTMCDMMICGPQGACCTSDGNCDFLAPADCTQAGGFYNGDEVACEDVDCAATGACCNADETCDDATYADCIAAGSSWQGPDSDCAAVTCTALTGACCLANGTCVADLTRPACLAQAGVYAGDDSDCMSAQCDVAGACCLTNGACLSLVEAACVSIAGMWQGAMTGCPSDCAALLLGDLNCDGSLTVSDIGPFVLVLTDVATYDQQFPACDSLAADMNQDGATTVSDIGGFIAAIVGG